MNTLKGFVETSDGIDQNIKDQVLSGGDVDFVRFGRLAEELRQVLSPFQESQGMREKELTFRSERLAAANATAFLIKLDPQTLFECQKPIAHALFGDMQDAGR
jgi:hypothetical protein